MELVWAVDATIAGVPYRFATQPVEVDGETYGGGLGDLELSKRAALDESIDLVITTADDWPARFVAAGWLVDGGAVTIWLVVVEGGNVTRRRWFVGVVERAQWDVRGSPLQISARHRAGEYTIPHPRERIDQYTHPQHNGPLLGGSAPGTYTLAEAGVGQVYPIPIGYPGYNDQTGEPEPVMPVPLAQVDNTVIAGASSGNKSIPEHLLFVIGPASIEAKDAIGYDAGPINLSDGLPLYDEPIFKQVTSQTDKLGQGYRAVQDDWLGDFSGDPRMYVGFKPRIGTGYGGGVVWRGKVIRGASDLFEWMIRTYTDVEIDYGAHRAHAELLNEYRFDTWINEPVQVSDWLDGAILEYVPAVIARGSQGLYLAHVPWTAGHEGEVIEITAGVNAQRGAVTTDSADVINELTVSYGALADNAAYMHAFMLGPEHARLVAVTSGGVYPDPRALASQWSKTSAAAYGPRPGRIELPTIYDTTTAHRVGADYLISKALPVRAFVYDLPPEQHQISIGAIASLTDEERYLDGIKCVVTDVTVSTTRVAVTLRPLRYATSYL